jgi:hypothetical protein
MKRSMELIRDLLLFIRDNDEVPGPKSFPGVEDHVVLGHLLLLREAKLTDGYEVNYDEGEQARVPTVRPRLTWKGHNRLSELMEDE